MSSGTSVMDILSQLMDNHSDLTKMASQAMTAASPMQTPTGVGNTATAQTRPQPPQGMPQGPNPYTGQGSNPTNDTSQGQATGTLLQALQAASQSSPMASGNQAGQSLQGMAPMGAPGPTPATQAMQGQIQPSPNPQGNDMNSMIQNMMQNGYSQASPYFQQGQQYLDQAAQAKMRAAQIPAPQMQSPVNRGNVLQMAVPLILAALTHQRPAAVGALAQGMDQGAQGLSQMNYQNQLAQRQQQQGVPLTQAANLEQQAQMQFGRGSAITNANMEIAKATLPAMVRAQALIAATQQRGMNTEQTTALKQNLIGWNNPLNPNRAADGLAANQNWQQMTGDSKPLLDPDLIALAQHTTSASENLKNSQADKAKADAQTDKQRGDMYEQHAALYGAQAKYTPGLYQARTSMYQALGHLDVNKAAEVAETTALMPQKEAAQVAAAYGSANKLNAEGLAATQNANTNEGNMNINAGKLQGLLRGQDAENIRNARTTLSTQADSIRTNMAKESATAAALAQAGNNAEAQKHYDNLTVMQKDLDGINRSYAEISNPLIKLSGSLGTVNIAPPGGKGAKSVPVNPMQGAIGPKPGMTGKGNSYQILPGG